MQLISEGSEKTAAGIESSSSSTSNNGADMVAEGLEILTTCLKEYQATIEEIREIENSLWD